MTVIADSPRIDGFDAVLLRSPSGELDASFVPSAGMVCASLRHRGKELLGQRMGVRQYACRGATFGIPLLHPWANRLSADHYDFGGRRGRIPAGAGFVTRDDHGLAIHGLLEPSDAWTVDESEPGRTLRAELEFGADSDLAPAFPFPHRIALDVELGDAGLSIRTRLTPTANVAVPVSFGFHPYLRLPGVPRRAWTVSLPAMRHVELDLDGIPTGRSRPQLAGTGGLGRSTFDDAYLDVQPGAAFALEGGGRRITVRFERGYPVAQIFAPATDDVVCFEPMTAPVDALVTGEGLPSVAPGRSFIAAFSIEVEAT